MTCQGMRGVERLKNVEDRIEGGHVKVTLIKREDELLKHKEVRKVGKKGRKEGRKKKC